MELKYGGQLEKGDFIAVSNGNHITFGWYAGEGRGTLQYWWMGCPNASYERYQDWLKLDDQEKQKSWWKGFQKGFSVKCLFKSYINAVHSTRVMKIKHPEDIFTTQKDLETYEKSRDVLISLNIVKR